MAEERTPLPERLVIRRRRPTFSKEQRVGFGLFLGIGALAVVLGTVYISRHLSTPFVLEYDGEPVLAGPDQAAAQLALLQESDTDGDGITDYYELYVYSTSPYLEDTDGDGYSDADELASGNDPNCIKGQSCTDSETDQASGELTDDFIEETFGDSLGVTSADELEYITDFETFASQVDPIQILLDNTTPEEVREMFIDAGVDPSIFDGMSDEEVMDMFLLAIEELEATGELDDVINEAIEAADL